MASIGDIRQDERKQTDWRDECANAIGGGVMPSISHFYGLTIWLYWDIDIREEELMSDWRLATQHGEVFKIRGLDQL